MRVCAIVLLVGWLSACGGDTHTAKNTDSAASEQLNAARLKWASKGIDEYRLQITKDCECIEEPDTQTWLVMSDTNLISEVSDEEPNPLSSVERLFTFIEASINRDDAVATVTYDATLGFPKIIRIDPNTKVTGDESEYHVYLSSNQQIRAEIARNKALWNSRNIRNYTMSFQIKCHSDCDDFVDGSVVHIEVSEGRITTAKFVHNAEEIDPALLERFPVSIEEQFEVLEEYANYPQAEVHAWFTDDGYPHMIAIHPDYRDRDNAIRGEVVNIHYRDKPHVLNENDVTKLEKLQAARTLWRSTHLDSYRYLVERSCFCPGPHRHITAVNKGVSQTFLESGEPIEHQQNPHFDLSIELLFSEIERAIKESDADVTAEYDFYRGYPVTVRFDWVQNAIDDEVAYRINLTTHHAVREALAKNKNVWEADGFANYELQYYSSCKSGCSQTSIHSEVYNGEVYSVRQNGQLIDPASATLPTSVNGLFDWIDTHAASPLSIVHVVSGPNGYPRIVAIDSNIFDEEAIREFFVYSLAELPPRQNLSVSPDKE